MLVGRADRTDVAALARLKWRAEFDRQATESEFNSFAADLSDWWQEHVLSHSAFLARTEQGDAVGAAWLALLPRVPRPGSLARFSADLQSVFVLPEHRGRGIASMLVEAAFQHATAAGAGRVTVHSSEKAVPLYRRLGFDTSAKLLQRIDEVERHTR